ncbi:MAG: glycosyltransferase [Ignavibacteriae bacterium]|nr:glycosyltransferase [Ignavibacteriota bacterium]
MKKKIPILLVVNNRPHLLTIILNRLLKYTDWNIFELWILDNFGSDSVKHIISAYTCKYSHIRVFEQNFNQISIIQNEIIKKLKAEIYIKLDDDIFVTKNWTNGFVNVLERNKSSISIGSVVIPVNGYGWKIFLESMNLVQKFNERFPNINIIQGCMEPAVWGNNEVVNFIWENSLNIDITTERFINNNLQIKDFGVPYRYSIGAISFTHDFWEKMGGWKVDSNFSKKWRINQILTELNQNIAKIRKREQQRRIQKIINILTSIDTSALGVEEEYLFEFSNRNNLNQYVTNESIVFHFSFGATNEYLMKKKFLDILKYESI